MVSPPPEPSPDHGQIRPPAGRVSFLDHALWRQLAEGDSLEAIAAAWLGLQCRMMAGVGSGVVVLGPADRGPFVPVAVHPGGSRARRRLLTVAERALAERRGVAQGGRAARGEASTAKAARPPALALPIMVEGRLHGVVALELSEEAPDLRQRLRELQWGTRALEYALYRNEVSVALAHGAGVREALELVAAAVEEPRFEAAAIALVTALAERLSCERVSIGFRRRGRSVVQALSHSAQFGRHMNIVRLLAGAMDEAIDQLAIVAYPASETAEPQLERAHRELRAVSDGRRILTVPFANGEQVAGALVLERSAELPFTAGEIDTVECVAGAVGPVLEEKRRNDRLLALKAVDSTIGQLERLFGPHYYGRKLAALAAAAIVAFFALATGTYRVTAEAAVEGTVQRAVIAAFDGYVDEELARAGDLVRAGDVLARLDERDLRLERARLSAERQELAAEHARALAVGDRAEINIIRERIAQVEAQEALIEQQLARAVIRAPFDGVVVAGDLSQVVGAAVERGQELFTIAPLDSYRVVLQVEERQIAELEAGQRGTLVLTALPDEPLPIAVERLTPVAEAGEGSTRFRVEAQLEAASERLRPGMEGIAKVEIEERHLIWIWTRGLIDWVRLAVWRYWP
jgi:RND family efflux transporter MFP subunit